MEEKALEPVREKVKIADREIALYSLINCPVDDLHPSDYNPNEADEVGIESLARSIKQNPKWLLARPVIVNTFPGREYIIIAGEKRWLAAKKLGYTKIPAMFVYDDLLQEKADNERDNIHAGTIDPQKEKALLEELRDSGFDLTGIGYNASEMVDHLNISDDPSEAAAANPENNGTTPAQDLQCPKCGHTGKKKEFRLQKQKE